MPLPKIFTPLYKNYLNSLEEAKELTGLQFDELLFNANPYSILSGGLSARGLETIFKEYRRRLHLTILTPKSLRQACIFKWLTLRIKAPLIKEWMGVAPSYSMKLYEEHSPQNPYSEDFL